MWILKLFSLRFEQQNVFNMSRMKQTLALNAFEKLQASNFLIYYQIVDKKNFLRATSVESGFC